MGLFRKFVALQGGDKLLFLKAIAVSLIVKVVVFALPMRWYSKFLNQPHTLSKTDIGNEDLIKRIKIAVGRCSRYAPWSTRCLVDAITAKLLLQWSGINSTLYLGVYKENRKLVAHAWLKCGDRFITGQKGYQKFTVVSRFA